MHFFQWDNVSLALCIPPLVHALAIPFMFVHQIFFEYYEFCSSKNLAHLTNVKLPGVRYTQRFVLHDRKSYANGAQGELNLAEQW